MATFLLGKVPQPMALCHYQGKTPQRETKQPSVAIYSRLRNYGRPIILV